MSRRQRATGGQIRASVISQQSGYILPGRWVRHTSPWSARITCVRCGDFHDVVRVESEPLKPADLPEIATSWDHACDG